MSHTRALALAARATPCFISLVRADKEHRLR